MLDAKRAAGHRVAACSCPDREPALAAADIKKSYARPVQSLEQQLIAAGQARRVAFDNSVIDAVVPAMCGSAIPAIQRREGPIVVGGGGARTGNHEQTLAYGG